jgi:hypothetical protein
MIIALATILVILAATLLTTAPSSGCAPTVDRVRVLIVEGRIARTTRRARPVSTWTVPC